MTYHHKLQANRLELKYVLDERRARAVSDFVKAYLPPDEHVQDTTRCSYPVYSLYLDSPSLVLYRQTLQGLKNRFKLRIRYYDDRPTSPAFLEIKRRLTNVIRKERAAMSKEGAIQFLNGAIPDRSHLIQSNGNRGGSDAFDRFRDLCQDIGAVGSAFVYYMREAYVSPESDNLRVTFDRRLEGTAAASHAELSPPTEGVFARTGAVVLEVKFVDRYPRWIQEMIHEFNLQNCSMAKYIHCVDALGLSPSRWLNRMRGLQGVPA